MPYSVKKSNYFSSTGNDRQIQQKSSAMFSAFLDKVVISDCHHLLTFLKVFRILKFSLLIFWQKFDDPPADASVCYYCKYSKNDWRLVKECTDPVCEQGKKKKKLSCNCVDHVNE